jgi:hypothetical protein
VVASATEPPATTLPVEVMRARSVAVPDVPVKKLIVPPVPLFSAVENRISLFKVLYVVV